jgi:ABC-2 type transport system ATP-binding protein
MLTGIIPPTDGTVEIGGFDIRKHPNKVKKITGLVPQDLALYPTLSARTNLEFFGRIYGLHGKDLRERVEDVLRIAALEDRAEQAIEKYSGGMKRRINIAAGLVHHPKLLFLDEPTVGVDPQSRNHIFESVMKLNRERGMSIVYTSHYMEEVELLCSRVAIIDQGRIIAMDTIKNLIALLGGGVIHVGFNQIDEATLAEISDLPAIKQASLTASLEESDEKVVDTMESKPGQEVVKIVARQSQEVLINLLSYTNDHDLQVTSLEILEPNLESVFLHLTGKKLRE